MHEGAFWGHHVGIIFCLLRGQFGGGKIGAIVFRGLAGAETGGVRGGVEAVGFGQDAGFGGGRGGGGSVAEAA